VGYGGGGEDDGFIEGEIPREPDSLATLSLSTCSVGNTTNVAVDQDLPAGTLVVVRYATRSNDEAATTVSDSANNGYTLDAAAHNLGVGTSPRIDIFSSKLDSALPAGSTITVTHADTRANAVAIDILPATAGAIHKAEATGSPPSGPTLGIDVTEPSILYAASAIPNNPAVTEDTRWTQLASADTDCGGAPGNMHMFAHYKLAGPGTHDFVTELDENYVWAAAIVAYPQ
jgi:hypothetical protein